MLDPIGCALYNNGDLVPSMSLLDLFAAMDLESEP